jgi:nudix-type nucleoside diphosphatase (YffH/AdpP family)
MARLDYYEGPFGYGTQGCTVETADGARIEARVYVPEPGLWQPGDAWSLDDWAARLGETIVVTSKDVMALYPEPIAPKRRGPMLVRGASRLRAAKSDPAVTRREAMPGDVVVETKTQPYANFFAVEEYELAFRRFDGGMSASVNRAAFVSGDAVTVLPYDPRLDRVLFVEQFRTGPFARGDAQPWQLEPIAGRVDPFETPAEAAHREAEEEAGLVLRELISIGSYYPSPGAKTEYLTSFIALADLPDEAAIIGGVASEAEDIKGHILSFADFAGLVARGEATNAPLLISYYWLARERPRIMAEAAGTKM